LAWAEVVVLVTGHDCYWELSPDVAVVDTCSLLR
jgi:hypothetical protein